MYNASSQLMRTSLDTARVLASRLTIKTATDTWELGESDIRGSSIAIYSSCLNKSFELGAAIASSLSVSLDNRDGRWNDVVLDGASIFPYCGYLLADGTTEYVPMGVFIVDRPSRPYGTLEIKAADRLILLDEPLASVAITYPTTQKALLNAISNHCNVPLSPSILDLTNISQKLAQPTQEDMTCRDAVSEIALMHAGFARMNRMGLLEIIPFENPATKLTTVAHVNAEYEDDTVDEVDEDIGHFTIDELFIHFTGLTIHLLKTGSRKSFKQTTDPITITGMRYGDTLWGTDDYVLEIGKLRLLDGEDIEAVLDRVWLSIEGFAYTGYDVDYYGNPALDAGDGVFHEAMDGRHVRSLITKHSYKHGGSCNMQAEGESKTAAAYKSANERRLSQLVGEATDGFEEQLTNYQQASAQLSDMMSQMMGVYETIETLEDGSYIYYKHNNPLKSESEIIWRFDGQALAFTSDGGLTWDGMTADSNLVIKLIETIGINAEWITLSSGSDLDTAYTHIDGGNITTGTIQGGKVKLDLSEGTFLIGDSSTDYSMYFDGTDLYLGGATSLSWGNITNKPNIPSVPGYITSTKITATTIESPNIVGNAGQIANFSIREKHIGANATDGSWWYIATYGATHPTTGVPLNHLIRMHDGSNNPLFGVSVNGEVAAKSFVNLTPAYTGNALEEIAKIKADSKGDIDHSTLPKFAQAKIEKMTDPNIIVDKGEMQIMSAHEPEYIEGQDIGAMVSVLTKAVQELIAKNEELDAAISALGQKMA